VLKQTPPQWKLATLSKYRIWCCVEEVVIEVSSIQL
jgi:hypothetical protein